MRCRCRQRCRLGLFAALALSLHLIALLLVGLFFLRSDRPLAGGGGEVSVVIEQTSPTPLLTKEGARGRSLPFPSGEQTADETGAGPAPIGEGSGPEGHDPLLAAIRARIERAKYYPEIALRSRIEGRAAVRFTIDKTGRPVDIRLAASSGSPVLDDAAREIIRRASPYPLYQKPIDLRIGFYHE